MGVGRGVAVVGVSVTTAVGVGVAVRVGIAPVVGVGVGVAAGVGVGVATAVGVGVASGWVQATSENSPTSVNQEGHSLVDPMARVY